MDRVVKVGDVSLYIKDGVIKERYTIVNLEGKLLSESVTMAPSLGSGGFGTVVRAKDTLGIPRAIKIVVDVHAGADDSITAGSTSAFNREIRLSNAQPFTHVIPVMDYGTERDASNREFGFFVSHFVEGTTLLNFVRESILGRADEILSTRELKDHAHDLGLTLANDILKAVVELDHARVVHMDLKPTNILVHAPAVSNRSDNLFNAPGIKAFVIDLGAAKPISDEIDGLTVLRWTPYWFPKYLLPVLTNNGTALGSEPSRIVYDQLKRCWKRIDLFSCGRVFEWMFLDRIRRNVAEVSAKEALIGPERKKEEFWRAVFGDDFLVIEGIIDSMLSENPVFEAAIDAKLAFEIIPLRSSRSILSSNTLTDRYPGVKFRTGQPIVRVSPPFDEIVAHPMFQRLRLIQQLSFVSEVFPDGTHNRFAHSLRTFETAKQFILGLQRRTAFRLLFQRKDIELLLGSALLHDVGQYPFAHTIEDLRKMGDFCGDDDLKGIRHDQELARRILSREEDGGPSISALLETAGISVDDLTYVILKSPKNFSRPASLNVTRDLISGLIDIDRVSYLVHDSERTGVPYGRAIDVGSLTEALTIRWGRNLAPEDIGLALEEGGVSAAEAVLTGVYWMYRDVYWVHDNRAFMSAVKFLFRHLLKAKVLTFDEYWEKTLRISDWEALRFLRDRYADWSRKDGQDGINPLNTLVEHQRIGYERVFTLRCIPEDDKILYNRLVGSVSPANEDLLIQIISDFLPASTRPKHGEILIDIPLKRRLRGAGNHAAEMEETAAERGTKTRIWVCVRGTMTHEIKRWVDLMDYSPLAGHMGVVEDIIGRRIRVFFSRSLVKRLSHNDFVRIENELLSELNNATKTWTSSNQQMHDK